MCRTERDAREEAARLCARAEAAGDLSAAAALAEDRERAARDQAQALAQVLVEREATASAEEELRNRVRRARCTACGLASTVSVSHAEEWQAPSVYPWIPFFPLYGVTCADTQIRF